MMQPAVTQEAHCPLHANAELKPAVNAQDWMWGIGGRFSYSECPQCRTWVLTPRPAPQEMGAFYAGYYSDNELKRWHKAVARRGVRVALRSMGHAREIREHAHKAGTTLPESPKVLDVGAGLGFFLVATRQVLNAQPRGVDTSARCREFAKDVWHLDVDTGELAEQHYPDDSFDLVATRNCLEHVYDPVKELAELHRVLKPGGLLEIEIPTPRLLARVFRGFWCLLQPPTHLWHFPVAALHALVRGAGFEVLATRSVWTFSEVAGSLLMMMRYRGVVPRMMFPRQRPWLLLLALAPFAVVDLFATRLLKALDQTGSVRILCRKPAAPRT